MQIASARCQKALPRMLVLLSLCLLVSVQTAFADSLSVKSKGIKSSTKYSSAKFKYPVFEGPFDSLKRLNELLADEAKNYVKEFISEFDPDEFNSLAPYEADVDCSISYASNELISFSYLCSEYTGGAHPNYWYDNRNYLLRDGRFIPVYLYDLINVSPKCVSVISDIVIKQLTKDEASSVIYGQVTALTLGDLTNFQINGKGLVFVFNPYEMGSFAEGTYSVNVPYSSIKEFIPAGSPLRMFL
jgi:hypothetical protein